MKKCTKCDVEKPLEEYGSAGARLRANCKSCVSEYNRKRYSNPILREREQFRAIKTKYGLSKEQYLEMVEGGCQMCHTDIKLVVDHCHDTGRVRGILCHWCNIAIGHLKDNPELALRAYYYLGGSDVA